MFSSDSHHARAYQEVTNAPHRASLSHELIGGAAAFAAAKAYEKYCAENGKPVNHAMAKELLAGFAGAFIVNMVETKGLDFIDHHRAKHEAMRHLEEPMAVHYPGQYEYPGQQEPFHQYPQGPFLQYPGQHGHSLQYPGQHGHSIQYPGQHGHSLQYPSQYGSSQPGQYGGPPLQYPVQYGGPGQFPPENYMREYATMRGQEFDDRGRHHGGLLGGLLGSGLLGGLFGHEHNHRHHEGHHGHHGPHEGHHKHHGHHGHHKRH